MIEIIRDPNAILLLHGDDLTDSSIYRHSITNSGVTVSTAQSKFGGKSLYFNGSSAKLVIPYSNVFDFGTGDFTIDLWMYPQTTSAEQSIFSSVATGGFFFSIRDASRMGIGRVLEAWDTTINASLTANAWNHVAVVRSNSTVMLFINGVLKGSGTNTTSYSMGGDSIQIGAETNACYYNGYVDEFRVSNVARWTANFTPPTAPYISCDISVTPGGIIPQKYALRRRVTLEQTTGIAKVNLTGIFLNENDTTASFARVIIDGVTYNTPQVISVPKGTQITLRTKTAPLYSDDSRRSRIIVNGEIVKKQTAAGQTLTYTYTANTNCYIEGFILFSDKYGTSYGLRLTS